MKRYIYLNGLKTLNDNIELLWSSFCIGFYYLYKYLTSTEFPGAKGKPYFIYFSDRIQTFNSRDHRLSRKLQSSEENDAAEVKQLK